MRALESVLLDVDGTLVDSNDAHARAWVEACGEAGHEVSFEAVRRLIGMGGDNLLETLLGLAPDDPRSGALRERRKAIYKQRHLPRVQPFPRVRELLERMKAAGYRLVVATSSSQDDLRPTLELAGVSDLIDDATTADDAETSKPAPDIVTAAREKAGSARDATLLLGDTPYDLEAARRAGVAAIALRCGGGGDRDRAGAAAIYDDPADLLAQWEASPLASGAATP